MALTWKDLDKLHAQVSEICDNEELPVHLKEGYFQIRDGIEQLKRDTKVWELLNKGRNPAKSKRP